MSRSPFEDGERPSCSPGRKNPLHCAAAGGPGGCRPFGAESGEKAISHNTWIHRIARVAVRPLVGTPVTPNHLTTLRLATGLAGAGALAVGASPWQHVGAAIFVVSLVLDRADGELARLAGKTSPWGHTYDLIADAAADALVFVGLGVGLRESALGQWAIPMGMAAGVAVAAIFWLIMRIEAVEGEGAAELPNVAGFDIDDSLLIVPVAVWLGGSVPLLVAAAIGAPAFAVFFCWLLLRRRASEAAPDS